MADGNSTEKRRNALIKNFSRIAVGAIILAVVLWIIMCIVVAIQPEPHRPIVSLIYQIITGFATSLLVSAVLALVVWYLTDAKEQLTNHETQNTLEIIQDGVKELQSMPVLTEIPGSDTPSAIYNTMVNDAIGKATSVEFYGITGATFFRRIYHVQRPRGSSDLAISWFAPNPAIRTSFEIRANFEHDAKYSLSHEFAVTGPKKSSTTPSIQQFVRSYIKRWLGSICMACQLLNENIAASATLYLLDYVNLNRYIMTNDLVFYEIFEELSKERYPGTYVFPFNSTGYRSLASNSYAYRSAVRSKNMEVRERVRKYEIVCTSDTIESIVSNNLKELLCYEHGRNDDVMRELVEFLEIGGTGSDDNLGVLTKEAVSQASRWIAEDSMSRSSQFR